jgi:hypothetical protein
VWSEKDDVFSPFFILMTDLGVNSFFQNREIKTINVIKSGVVDRVERTLYGQLSLEMRDV